MVRKNEKYIKLERVGFRLDFGGGNVCMGVRGVGLALAEVGLWRM